MTLKTYLIADYNIVIVVFSVMYIKGTSEEILAPHPVCGVAKPFQNELAQTQTMSLNEPRPRTNVIDIHVITNM